MPQENSKLIDAHDNGRKTGDWRNRRFFIYKGKNKSKLFYSFGLDNEPKFKNDKEKGGSKNVNYKNLYLKITNNKFYNVFIVLYTFFVIFNKDLFYVYTDKKYDGISDAIIFFLFITSLIEMIMNVLIREDYTFSFCCFDVLSLIFLIFDFSFCEDKLFYLFCSLARDLHIKEAEKEQIYSIIQFFKLLNFIKIYKIIICYVKEVFKDEYKYNEILMKKTHSKLTFTKKMHLALITKYFISLICIMLFMTLLKMATVTMKKSFSNSFLFYHLNELSKSEQLYEEEFLNSLYFHSVLKKDEPEYISAIALKKPLKYFVQKKEIYINKQKLIIWDFSYLTKEQLLKFSTGIDSEKTDIKTQSVIILDNSLKSLSDLRFNEIKAYHLKNFIFYMNIKKAVQNIIQKKILLKIFIIIFSIVALIYFINELNTILFPLEGILKKLKLMKMNPTLALGMQEDLLKYELNMLKNANSKRNATGIYEIVKMEENLMKLGTLMLLGFGEAGTKIISKNINEQERINLLTDGEIVHAVFSFCDIRNFTEITEVLKEKIMIFINLVANIIHDCCDFYGGTINKNIGDAFLLIWKCKTDKNYFKSSITSSDFRDAEEKGFKDTVRKQYINRVCDLALLSTVQTLIKLQQSLEIRSFLQNKQFKGSSFCQSSMKSINLCFGLHFGWAIEGPIGSRYKIDLSYLSENVNIASRLQDISKVYKTNIVISENFYENLSDRFKKLIRKIDRVILKGCGTAMNLYTFDSCYDNISAKLSDDDELVDAIYNSEHLEQKTIKILKDIEKREKRKKRKKEIFNIHYDLYDDYLKDHNAQSVTVRFPKQYLILFKEALNLYLNGEWQESKKKLEFLKHNYSIQDNIAEQLFQFMKMSNFESPSDWCGFRKFQQK